MTSLLKSLDDVGSGMQRLSAAQTEQTAMAAQLVRRMKTLEGELVELIDSQRRTTESGAESA